MKGVYLLVCCFFFALGAHAQPTSASSLSSALHELSIDRSEIYRVRDVRIARGDISLYLTDGYLAFASPVNGRQLAAVFTTAGTEAGEAEAVIAPPTRGERSSLAYFTKTPNLDEHFNDAVFLFTDELRGEVQQQMERGEVVKTPEQVEILAPKWNQVLRNIAADVQVSLISSLLNQVSPSEGIFYGVLSGRTLGIFDVTYDPSQYENSAVGRVSGGEPKPQFEVWASFRSRRSPPLRALETLPLHSYRIDTVISDDMRVSAITRFRAVPRFKAVRALDLQISHLMNVSEAYINGNRAEVFQRNSVRGADDFDIGRFLVIATEPLAPDVPAEVEIHHEGAVIQTTGDRVYFVEARNIWFPHRPLSSATFDLTFHSPAALRVVSSGKLVNESVEGRERSVHRVLDAPARFVGFNVGEFTGTERTDAPFHIECFASNSLLEQMRSAPNAVTLNTGPAEKSPAPQEPAAILANLAAKTGDILRTYAKAWGLIAATNISVTPIPGTFGQGFPGLIYLSGTSYLPEAARAATARGPLLDTFYSDILLPHEIAHQWWGNVVVPSDYRSGWILEALPNYAAWQLLEKRNQEAAKQLLAFFLHELRMPDQNGRPMESLGPLDLGLRLKSASNPDGWRVVTYDKGTWVIRMLEKRLGEERFEQFLRTLVSEYSTQPLSNDAFRTTATRFLDKADLDPTLEVFFDSWVYGTGLPNLSLKRRRAGSGQYELQMTGVDKDFTADVPITMKTRGKPATTKWVRVGAESVVFDAGPPSATATLPAASDFLYIPE
jgi:hypothetical protein